MVAVVVVVDVAVAAQASWRCYGMDMEQGVRYSRDRSCRCDREGGG